MMAAPVLRDIVRQHAEMAAFLWTIYDHHLLNPDENPEMDEVRLARLVERLDAHLDGLRVAGDQGRKIAQERYEEFPEAGELFVLRMLAASKPIQIVDLDLIKVRQYLAVTLRRKRL
ncbi:hypothetical protein EOA27_02735 [Mesorhizobium sp. M2A.F.Ca.ET.037.01.1.1]|uniref:hypothetical protein n=1 Tax=unclassified Mesorhizobium TaxID=325217 RepID=UPI000F74F3D5|nr:MULTISPECIES: hypothetical protein [unclassified Mesorhizobium]RUY09996.1 hypothetical protein EOA25_09845 [Mesorhizobium sp. M2A.F.Ca.ET.040.01.1.1]RVC67079.1 hypothetical protein EN759_16630 [Mesorhizobium sp. M00.F.Ca.ET.038.03.1.1]RVC81398.1 hypothetical protein EN766_03325 [Mesorhizobium sp. M2A.F.Ca.ET.046.02.1.1]AZO34456.1 hypothetical protein EJ072_08320 [Mesorhizobium sp. M2A.F.Ca.ET.046.03.2.1]RUX22731.1 hypothetical protein EOA27_02735 [Mesorhizobium sp. M2A.F.Ca.ET.037.01.1.1]